MQFKLNLYNITGYATFKYKCKPNNKGIYLVKKLYEHISKGMTEKVITIFDIYGNSTTLKIKNNILYSIEGINFKITDAEEILGYILAYMSKTSDMYIIIREKNNLSKSSIIYGFNIHEDTLYSIPAKTLENLNNNARLITGFNPETDIQFIDT